MAEGSGGSNMWKDALPAIGVLAGGICLGVSVTVLSSYIAETRRLREEAEQKLAATAEAVHQQPKIMRPPANPIPHIPGTPKQSNALINRVQSVPDFTSLDRKIFRVVLTGGPCGGKTTALNILTNRFRSEGWRVYCVPEVATLLWEGGVEREELHSAEPVYQFQTNLLKVMQALEEAYLSMARVSGQKSIIFCDRGTMDSSAYMDPHLWQALLDENHWTKVGLRDERYDCVVHLVTAAIGAEEHYNTDSNVTRVETIEEAASADIKLAKAWIGHPYLVMLDNTVDFKAKMDRVIGVVSNRAEGRIEPCYSKRKFLIAEVPAIEDFPLAFEDFDVEYDYLIGNLGERARISKRGQYGSYIYTYMNVGVESTKRSITGREYIALLQQRDRTRQNIRQKQRYFIYNYQCWHLCWWITPQKGLCLLQVYTRDDTEDIDLPPFLVVEKEVTKSPDYNMYNLAGRDD